MKNNIELFMSMQFADIAVCNLDAVMKDDSLSDKEFNAIREAHDSIASARDSIERMTKPQRMVSAEAKESGYGESEDEEIVKLADEYYDKVLLKECDMKEKEAHHCRLSYIHGAKAMLEKQGTSYTKRDVDDAYVEGMAFAKDELEKQKPTWSVDDTFKVQRICKYLDEAKKYYADITEVRDCIDWLKSLKERYTWKPSKEQMDAMQMVVSYFGYSWISKEQKLLESLYKDLKKL